MEESLKDMRPTANTYVLRSSIILGSKAPIAPEDAHDTFLHFCATRNGQETDLWVNEYRTVVSVQHACNVIDWMIQQNMPGDNTCSKGEFHIFNFGGNLRVNRLDMAKAVFAHFGFESKGILKAAEQTSPSGPPPAPAPPPASAPL
jgi:dTDP-4-dehydrorhamnose reductase